MAKSVKISMENSLDHVSMQRDLIELIDNLILVNLGNCEFNMEQVAQQLNISRSKLYSVIKKASKSSPGKYLLKRRLDEGMMLLHDYKLNITQIAYKVGFKKSASFSNAFKERFGKTPKQVMSEFINGSPNVTNEILSESYKGI